MPKNCLINSRNLPTLACAISAFLLGSVDAAQASVSPQNFGEMLCNVIENAKPFGSVFQWVAYIAGVVFAIVGIHRFRLHADDPRQHKLVVPIMFLGGAIGLLALPSFIAAVENSFYTPGGGGLSACVAEAPTITDSSGLDDMMIDFMTNIGDPLNIVTSLAAILAGLFFIIHGLMKAARYGTDPRAYSTHSILTCIGFGALLFTIGTNLDMILASVFGIDAKPSRFVDWGEIQEMMGANEQGMKRFEMAVEASLWFVQVIGAIAFVRGWLLLKKVVESAGSGNASLTQALTHILGGVLAVNIGQFLALMDKTFGVNLLDGVAIDM